jgi:hypothetical protein
VWVIRETVKNALECSFPKTTDNFNDAIDKMAQGLILDLKYWKKSSKLINFIKTQKTIDSYF